MIKHEPRIYYIGQREEKKAVLVFDAGHANGDIHIYEHKTTLSSKDILIEMQEEYSNLPDETRKEIVRNWVEKKFGHSISWKLE